VVGCSGKVQYDQGPDAAVVDAEPDGGSVTTLDAGPRDASTDTSVSRADSSLPLPDSSLPTPDAADSGGAINCTGTQTAQRWATMDREPIVPPLYAAGLPSGVGLTLTEAQQANCTCMPLGDVFDQAGVLSCSWGNNSEVVFTYYQANQEAWMVYLGPGYTGARVPLAMSVNLGSEAKRSASGIAWEGEREA
jgi:hypothetical protein